MERFGRIPDLKVSAA